MASHRCTVVATTDTSFTVKTPAFTSMEFDFELDITIKIDGVVVPCPTCKYTPTTTETP